MKLITYRKDMIFETYYNGHKVIIMAEFNKDVFDHIMDIECDIEVPDEMWDVWAREIYPSR